MSGAPLALWVVRLTAAGVASPQVTELAVTSVTLGDIAESEIPAAGIALAVTVSPVPPVEVAPTGAALAPTSHGSDNFAPAGWLTKRPRGPYPAYEHTVASPLKLTIFCQDERSQCHQTILPRPAWNAP